jgi:tRNA(Ile)-lysidine synthase
VSLPPLDGEVLAAVDEFSPLCVACSGGSDSTALLHLLHGRENLRPRLVVLHYDHGLRPSSEGDCAFVQELSRQLKLPFHWERRGGGRPVGEDALRRDRMAFFQKIMAKLPSPYLLTAHHRDDGEETLLLRLGRGAGLDGLTALRPIERFRDGTVHLRPLLKVAKSELISYLTAAGLPWREDGTNGLPLYCRNRVRNELLPLWRTIEGRRNLGSSLARSRELLREDAEALTALAEGLYGQLQEGGALLLPSARATPRALLRRLLYLFFLDHCHVLTGPQADGILKKLGKKFQLTLGPRLACHSDGAKIAVFSRENRADRKHPS